MPNKGTQRTRIKRASYLSCSLRTADGERYASIESTGALNLYMKKTTKVLLGLATLWPFLYMILFFVVIFSTIVFMPDSGGEASGAPPLIAIILPLHLLTMLAVMALMVFYIVNVFRNDRVDKDKKALWAVVLFMGSMIAMPIYWYLYIWQEPTADSPLPSQPPKHE